MAPSGNPSRIGVDNRRYLHRSGLGRRGHRRRSRRQAPDHPPRTRPRPSRRAWSRSCHEAGGGSGRGAGPLIHGTTLATQRADRAPRGARVGPARDRRLPGRGRGSGGKAATTCTISSSTCRCPWSPRQRRVEVNERVLARRVGPPPRSTRVQARAAISELGALGVEAIAICLLHALPQSGPRAGPSPRCARRILPGVSGLLPPPTWCRRSASTSAPPPPPRTCTLMPLMARYLDDLEAQSWQELGVPGRLYVMMSAGGVSPTPGRPPKRVPVRPRGVGPGRRRSRGGRASDRAGGPGPACSPSTWAAPPPRPA